MDTYNELKYYHEYLSGLRKISRIEYYTEEYKEIKDSLNIEEKLYDKDFHDKYYHCIYEICMKFIDTYNYICLNHRFNIEDFYGYIEIVRLSGLNYYLSPSQLYDALTYYMLPYRAIDLISSIKTDWKTIDAIIQAYMNKRKDKFTSVVENVDYSDIGIYLALHIKSENIICSPDRCETGLYDREMGIRATAHKARLERLLKNINTNKAIINKNVNILTINKIYDFITRTIEITNNIIQSFDIGSSILGESEKIIDLEENRGISISKYYEGLPQNQMLIDKYNLIKCYCQLFEINLLPYINDDETRIVDELLGGNAFSSIYKKAPLESFNHLNDKKYKEAMNMLEPILNNAIKAGYFERTESGYKRTNKCSKTLLAYLCGKLFCGDSVERGEKKNMGSTWIADDTKKFPDKTISYIFNETDIGSLRRNRKNFEPPVGWEDIDSFFV